VRRFAFLLLAAALSGAAAGAPEKARLCAPCHGVEGLSLQPDAPNIAGQPEVYLRDQLRAYRSGKRTHEVMGVIAKPLTDAEISELAAYYSAIAIELKKKP
jgi:cytochrome c553